MFKQKKYVHREYYINHTHLERLYNMYLHQTTFDRVLDNLVFFAIVFTISNLIVGFIFEIVNPILTILNITSKLILLVFAADLARHYVKAKSKRSFYAHHGIDLFLVVFLSLYFLFYTYLEIFRLTIITILKPLVYDMKHLRAVVELFDKEKDADEKYR